MLVAVYWSESQFNRVPSMVSAMFVSFSIYKGPCGTVVVKALCYKLEGRGFSAQ
jgi:hypothetical protein